MFKLFTVTLYILKRDPDHFSGVACQMYFFDNVYDICSNKTHLFLYYHDSGGKCSTFSVPYSDLGDLKIGLVEVS